MRVQRYPTSASRREATTACRSSNGPLAKWSGKIGRTLLHRLQRPPSERFANGSFPSVLTRRRGRSISVHSGEEARVWRRRNHAKQEETASRSIPGPITTSSSEKRTLERTTRFVQSSNVKPPSAGSCSSSRTARRVFPISVCISASRLSSTLRISLLIRSGSKRVASSSSTAPVIVL